MLHAQFQFTHSYTGDNRFAVRRDPVRANDSQASIIRYDVNF